MFVWKLISQPPFLRNRRRRKHIREWQFHQNNKRFQTKFNYFHRFNEAFKAFLISMMICKFIYYAFDAEEFRSIISPRVLTRKKKNFAFDRKLFSMPLVIEPSLLQFVLSQTVPWWETIKKHFVEKFTFTENILTFDFCHFNC